MIASVRFRGRRTALLLVSMLAALAVSVAGEGGEAVLPTGFHDQLIVGTVRLGVGMAFLPDGRLLVAEKPGSIRLIVGGGYGAMDPLMTVDSVYSAFLESGLMGIAVDPRWPTWPYVYAYYAADDSTLRISRYRAGGVLDSPTSSHLTLDRLSRFDLFRDIPDRNRSHNGGTLRFGPDGMLYVSLGDDQDRCSAQDTVSLRGVLLRLDVDGLPDGPGGPPARSLIAPSDNPYSAHPHPNARLVWAMGLRNPFRFHVDAPSGAVFVADVSWGLNEEINLADRAGMNFGWPYFEGASPHSVPCPPDSVAQFSQPIHFYNRLEYPLSAVVGAGVYRGTGSAVSFPAAYEGNYFYSDFYEGFMRRLQRVGDTWSIAPPVAGQPTSTEWGQGFTHVTDYLVGPDGALWYCRYSPFATNTTEIRRICLASGLVDVPGLPSQDVEFRLPHPSPARGVAHFEYALAREARVELSLYDIGGRRVRVVVPAGTQGAGGHTETWDGSHDLGHRLPAGLYLAVLSVDGVRYQRRLTWLR